MGSSVQGSKYAAPLWQAFMAKIHEDAGLEDRDILSKGPEELGLVQKGCARYPENWQDRTVQRMK